MKQKRGEALSFIIRGARDQNEMRGIGSPCDKPLATADAPAAIDAFGAGVDHAGIGPATGMRFGHRKRRTHFAIDDRLQPAVLLRIRAHLSAAH